MGPLARGVKAVKATLVSMTTATVAAARIVFPPVAPTMTGTALVIAKSALAGPVAPAAPAAKAVMRTSARTMTVSVMRMTAKSAITVHVDQYVLVGSAVTGPVPVRHRRIGELQRSRVLFLRLLIWCRILRTL